MIDALPVTSWMADVAALETPMTAPVVERPRSARLAPTRAGKDKHRHAHGFGFEQILTRPVSFDALEHALRSDFRSG